jgi:hypothetical protein
MTNRPLNRDGSVELNRGDAVRLFHVEPVPGLNYKQSVFRRLVTDAELLKATSENAPLIAIATTDSGMRMELRRLLKHAINGDFSNADSAPLAAFGKALEGYKFPNTVLPESVIPRALEAHFAKTQGWGDIVKELSIDEDGVRSELPLPHVEPDEAWREYVLWESGDYISVDRYGRFYALTLSLLDAAGLEELEKFLAQEKRDRNRGPQGETIVFRRPPGEKALLVAASAVQDIDFQRAIADGVPVVSLVTQDKALAFAFGQAVHMVRNCEGSAQRLRMVVRPGFLRGLQRYRPIEPGFELVNATIAQFVGIMDTAAK